MSSELRKVKHRKFIQKGFYLFQVLILGKSGSFKSYKTILLHLLANSNEQIYVCLVMCRLQTMKQNRFQRYFRNSMNFEESLENLSISRTYFAPHTQRQKGIHLMGIVCKNLISECRKRGCKAWSWQGLRKYIHIYLKQEVQLS